MNDIVALKAELLNMMRWFHSFCEKNGLRYYVLGGTMLGAVRHGGFIPWDDDIDVGMPREDYERLAELIDSDKYVLETPETQAKDFYYPFSKLYDTDTTLIENTKYKIKRGIYIDIFPLDGIGDSRDEAHENFKTVKKYSDLLMLKIAGFRKGRRWYKNLGVALFRLLPMNPKRLLGKLVSQCKKYSYADSLYVGNLVGAWGEREITHRDVMGTPTLYKFEDMSVYGAQNADEYLSSLYGDWRKLPPEEKRVSHHDFIEFNLKKSYLDK